MTPYEKANRWAEERAASQGFSFDSPQASLLRCVANDVLVRAQYAVYSAMAASGATVEGGLLGLANHKDEA